MLNIAFIGPGNEVIGEQETNCPPRVGEHVMIIDKSIPTYLDALGRICYSGVKYFQTAPKLRYVVVSVLWYGSTEYDAELTVERV